MSVSRGRRDGRGPSGSRTHGPSGRAMRAAWTMSLAAILLCVSWGTASSQELARPSVDWVGSVGTFSDFPEPFQARYCDQDAWALEGSLGYRVATHFRVRVGMTWANGLGEVECFLPGQPAPLPGTRLDQDAYDDDIAGVGFFATRVSVVAELTPRASSSLRGRLDALRILGKGLDGWSAGLGYRFSVGGNSVVVDLERWNLRIPFARQHILVGDEGQFIVESQERRVNEQHPLLLRLGYEIGIG